MDHPNIWKDTHTQKDQNNNSQQKSVEAGTAKTMSAVVATSPTFADFVDHKFSQAKAKEEVTVERTTTPHSGTPLDIFFKRKVVKASVLSLALVLISVLSFCKAAAPNQFGMETSERQQISLMQHDKPCSMLVHC